jgi:RNA polymerase sigma factor (sigma-70 family)
MRPPDKPPSELSQMSAEIDALYLRQRQAGFTGLSRELAVALLRWAGAAAWVVKGGASVNAYDREDAAQNALLSIQQNLARYEPMEAFHAWAMTILANKITDVLRRKAVRGELTPPPESVLGEERAEEERWGGHGVVSREPLPDAAALHEDDLRRLRQVCDELGDGDAVRAFKLRHLSGLKFEEVAALLGCSVTQAFKLAARGFEQIREKMGEPTRWKTQPPAHE